MPYQRGEAFPITDTGKSIPPLSYATDYGRDREFEITIAHPTTAGSYPLIVYCHGGASGASPGAYKTTDWAPVWAEYGYIVVMISHTEPAGGQDEINDITDHLGLGLLDEDTFKVMNYLRPFDIDAVLRKSTRIDEELSALGISIDRDRGFAVAGHSSGSGAALTHAGATRYFPDCGGDPYQHDSVERATCYLAYSIQGPAGVDHLCPGSWTSIAADLPVLAVSGANDLADAHERRLAFAEMAGIGHSKYAFWIRDQPPNPNHSFYNHKNWVGFTREKVWMEDVSLAYLDSYLKGVPAGGRYLDSDGVVADSDGKVQWAKR